MEAPTPINAPNERYAKETGETMDRAARPFSPMRFPRIKPLAIELIRVPIMDKTDGAKYRTTTLPMNASFGFSASARRVEAMFVYRAYEM
jgi:hypothetical protein